MMQTFYKMRPTLHTPYRQLTLEYENNVPQVRLISGEQWGQENAKDLRIVQVADFEAGLQAYNKEWHTLVQEGWKLYDPTLSNFA